MKTTLESFNSIPSSTPDVDIQMAMNQDVFGIMFSYLDGIETYTVPFVSKFFYNSVRDLGMKNNNNNDRKTFEFQKHMIFSAIDRNSPSLMDWIKSNGYFTLSPFMSQYKLEFNVCNRSAEKGCLEVLKWLFNSGFFVFGECICTSAASGGHLEILKWARSVGCPWNSLSCNTAARNGHFEILKWLRENECPWSVLTCSEIASNGNLEMLKWAIGNGCPWNKWCCTEAIRGGHLEVAKWAKENGCPWDESLCNYEAAWTAWSEDPEMLKWLNSEKQRNDRCSPK